MRKLLLSTLLATAAYAAPAAADPAFTVTDISVQGDIVTINSPIAPVSVYAGPLTLKTSIGTFIAWCVDLYHEVKTGSGQSLQYQLGTVTTDSAPTPNALSTDQQKQIASLAAYGQSLIGTANGTTDNLAAVQLAIWKVEYPTFSYTGASSIPFAATYDQHRMDAASDTGLLSLSGTQTFVTATMTSNQNAPSPVPEPAALALVATGLAMLGTMGRRRA